MDATDHPRPLLRRAVELLDGPWDFALDAAGLRRPDRVTFDREIVVPYAPETPASGVGEPWIDRCWYKRRLDLEPPGDGGRVLVHFGAVDREATVYANGSIVGAHEGGYTSFAVDVTDALTGGAIDLVVRADDDPTDLGVPRGKQDWLPEPHAIWYPRTTGIWRSVWVERVPRTAIASLDAYGSARSMTLDLAVRIDGPIATGSRCVVRVIGPNGRVLVDDSIGVTERDVTRTFAIGDGGLDDAARLTWWPRRPTLVDIEVALVDGRGSMIDRVASYTALRDVEVDDGRIMLNGRPYPLRFALDQGYWRQSGLTAPDVAALRRDIELTKALGFNGVRKHQKVEDPRYLALADRLGLLVWVEMPSPYVFSERTAAALVREWTEVVRSARGHPSVVGFVPVNESWGVPQVASSGEQRALLDALGAIAATFGAGRPVSVNDGWETAGGDIVGVHDYDHDPELLRARYGTVEAVDRLLTSARPDGRLSDLDRSGARGRAIVLSEFGGIALRAGHTTDDAWGYREAKSPKDLLASYAELWRAVHDSDVLAGACWTQLTDTYQEINGLLTMDRTPKVDVDDLAAATRGRLPS